MQRKNYREKGKKLVDIAKVNSKGRLTLYTFEVNRKAQLFYERNGLKIIDREHENEEGLDDIMYEIIRIRNTDAYHKWQENYTNYYG